MAQRLKRSFYSRDCREIAHDLIGKSLVRLVSSKDSRIDAQRISGTIIEIELYPGVKDRASHVYGGKRTARTEIEYGRGGHVYIYLVYGMYWQLNITTGSLGDPQCILIRALKPINSDISRSNGPGKLCSYFKLDGSFYGEDLVTSKRLWIEDAPIQLSYHKKTARINIDYAGLVSARKKLRLLDARYECYLAKVKSRYVSP